MLSLNESGLILKYFPSLSAEQVNLFAEFFSTFKSWNEKINLISRKDIDHLETHHILHSLSIAKIISFKKDTVVMDAGTGGGFPGVPLAIMFPEVKFLLVDSVKKKINVVHEICKSIGLRNIETLNMRAEDIEVKCDFVVTRALATLSQIYDWTKSKIRREAFNELPNGIICLKGGDLAGEIKTLKAKTKVYELNKFFTEEFFETKKIVFLPIHR